MTSPRSPSTRAPRIVIAGCGPGAADHVTPAVRRAVARADVVIGARRLLALFPRARAERRAVTADIAATLDRLAALLKKKRPRSRHGGMALRQAQTQTSVASGQPSIVVLVSGDPGFFSLARAVIARFGRAACTVIPGVSSMQTAFARVGASWENARLISAHTRQPTLRPATLRAQEAIGILAGNPATWSWVRTVAQALARTHTLYLCQNLTLPDESVRKTTPRALRAMPSASQTILLCLRRR